MAVFNAVNAEAEWFNGQGQGVKLFDAPLDLEDIRHELDQEQVYRKDVINTTAFQGNTDYLSGNTRTWSRTTSTQEKYAPDMGDGPPIGSVRRRFSTSHWYVGRTTNLPNPTSMSACWWGRSDDKGNFDNAANLLSFGDTGDTIGCNACIDHSGNRSWRLGNEQGNLLAPVQLFGQEECSSWWFYGIRGDGTGSEALEQLVWSYDGRFMCRIWRPIPSSYTIASLRFFSFMNESEAPYAFGGTICMARIFDAVLTNEQFEIERVSKTPYHTGSLNSCWSGRDPTCPDESGNGYDFTASGVAGHWDEPDLDALPEFLPPDWSPGNIAKHVQVRA
jgi:hypothetical protein